MSNIPVGNVVATFDVEELDKILNTGEKRIINLINNKNPKVFTFSSKLGNLIKFVHSYNFESEGEQRGMYITLEIIDPSNDFESRLLSYTVERTYGGIDKKLEDEINDFIISKPTLTAVPFGFKPEIKDFQKSVYGEIKGGPDKGTPFTTIKTDEVGFETANTEYNKAVEKYKEDLNEWENKQTKLINKLTGLLAYKPFLWFMYGASDILIDWAGPIGGQLINVSYNYTGEGAIRSLVMTFATVSFSIDKLAKKSLSLQEYTEGEAIIESLTPNEVNKGINTCINTYIQNILPEQLKGNIAIVLPNMYNLLQEKIKSIEREIDNTLDPIGQSRLTNRLWRYAEVFDETNEKLASKFRALSVKGDAERYIQRKIAINKLFSELGFTVASFDLEAEEKFVEDLTNPISKILDRNLVKDSFEINGKDYLDFATNILTKEKDLNYSQEYNKIKLVCAESDDNYYSPLNRIRDGIKEITGINLIYFFESDTRILKIWKDRKLITDPTRPVMLVTTEGIKNLYIYGDPIKPTNNSLDNISNSIDLQLTDKYKAIFNENYRKTLAQKIVQFDKKFKFGKLNELPDELAYDESFNKFVQVNKLPVFKSGYKDSNVLSLNMDVNALYTVELLNYREDTKDIYTAIMAVNSASLLKSKEFDLFNTDFEEIVKTLNQSFNVAVTVEALKEQINSNPRLYPTSPVEAVLLYLKLAKLALGKKVITTNESNGLHPIYIKTAIADRLAQITNLGVIHTLPYFHLSNNYTITSPIILLVRENKIVGPEVDPLLQTSPFTGLWNIWGFRHEISENNITSSFSIIKNTQTTISDSRLITNSWEQGMKKNAS